MFRKIVITVLCLGIGFALVGCQNHTSKSENNDKQVKVESDASILIVYFSWSGNTKKLANDIHEQIGGEMFEIEVEEPYTTDINTLSGQALQEQREQARPALHSHVENINQYDIIFVGYPNWWNDMPMPVFTFLEEYDFSRKMIVPFTTYGDGKFGKSITSLQNTLNESTIMDGLAIQENELDDDFDQIKDWLQNLGFAK